jgi:sRNA-binding protein
MRNHERAGASEPKSDTVEVRILRNCVISVTPYRDVESLQGGHTVISRINDKTMRGEVVELPREEARLLLRHGIAEVTADLI